MSDALAIAEMLLAAVEKYPEFTLKIRGGIGLVTAVEIDRKNKEIVLVAASG